MERNPYHWAATLPGPSGDTAATVEVWVRRCGACDELDVDAMFGRPELADDGYWRCSTCRTPAFHLDRLRLW